MIYIVLLIAVGVIVLIGFSSRFPARQMVPFTSVVLSYALMLFFFLFYLCKDAFHLNIFIEYFPMPRQMVLTFYSLSISKMTILSLLNFFSTIFFLCNILFVISFSAALTSGVRRLIYFIAGIYAIVQAFLFNPYIYKGLYSLCYPSRFSQQQIEDFFSAVSKISSSFTCMILISCIFYMVFATFRLPRIKIFQLSHLSVSISYGMLICSYIFFFRQLPGHFIRYSKISDIVTYRRLATSAQMEI